MKKNNIILKIILDGLEILNVGHFFEFNKTGLNKETSIYKV